MIRFTIVDTLLGRMLLAARDGVCALSFADEDAELLAFLDSEFASEPRERDEVGLRDWVALVRANLEGEEVGTAIPLDIRATDFQWRVWRELMNIPRGQTRSYAEVAAALGTPTAARAVARACATNPVSVLIPCHRVVRGDGSPSGYRWGLDRKERLQRNERAGCPASA